MASDALDVDGTEASARGLNQALSCRVSKQQCTALALSVTDPSARVGALVGRAARLANDVLQPNLTGATIVSLEPSVTEAEGDAREALGQARKNAAERAEHQKTMDAEARSIAAATVACGSDEGACSARCAKGEAPMCFALAVRLRSANPSKLDDARTTMAKACGMRLLHACAEVAGLDDQIRSVDETNRAWIDLRASGDDLAKAAYQQELALGTAESLPGQMALQRTAVYVRVIVDERYCPAKAVFLARASVTEFEQRAAEHCAADPPTNDGITGVTVPLTEACKAAFAVACP
jgi:hypothetical protein